MISLSKSEAARDYDARRYGWNRHHKRTVKTFLVKIKKLMWAQYVTAKESLTKTLIEVYSMYI